MFAHRDERCTGSSGRRAATACSSRDLGPLHSGAALGLVDVTEQHARGERLIGFALRPAARARVTKAIDVAVALAIEVEQALERESSPGGLGRAPTGSARMSTSVRLRSRYRPAARSPLRSSELRMTRMPVRMPRIPPMPRIPICDIDMVSMPRMRVRDHWALAVELARKGEPRSERSESSVLLHDPTAVAAVGKMRDGTVRGIMYGGPGPLFLGF